MDLPSAFGQTDRAAAVAPRQPDPLTENPR